MFEHIFKDPCAIKVHQEAPLYKERIEYIKPLMERGYKVKSLQTTENLLMSIVKHLDLQLNQTVTIYNIEKAANAFAHRKVDNIPLKGSFSKTRKATFSSTATIWLKKLNRLELLPEERIPIFNMLFKIRSWLLQQTTRPLLKQRTDYLQFRYEAGAKKKTLRVIAEYLVVIMDYLNFDRPRLISRKEIIRAANRWAKRKTHHYRKGDVSIEARNCFISQATKWLSYMNCLVASTRKISFMPNELKEYIDYMRNEKGLSEYTIDSQCRKLKHLLKPILTKSKSLSNISPQIIDKQIIRMQGAHSRISIRDLAGAFRGFLKFVEGKRWCRKGLADSIKTPRIYSQSSLPYPPQWSDIQRLIESCNTEAPTDIRDRAILMLLAVYGMRRSEVIKLQLDDLDWENDRIYIRRSKRSKPQIFPLSPNVGNAIIRYLQEVRPNNFPVKEVFLTTLAPYKSLEGGTIYQIVGRRLKPMQLKIAHHGPHALRHGCATHLINSGIPLNEIREHLGQMSMDSARIYSKVDLVSLRKVSNFNLKGLL